MRAYILTFFCLSILFNMSYATEIDGATKDRSDLFILLGSSVNKSGDLGEYADSGIVFGIDTSLYLAHSESSSHGVYFGYYVEIHDSNDSRVEPDYFINNEDSKWRSIAIGFGYSYKTKVSSRLSLKFNIAPALYQQGIRESDRAMINDNNFALISGVGLAYSLSDSEQLPWRSSILLKVSDVWNTDSKMSGVETSGHSTSLLFGFGIQY